jgi:hypothetical protein
VRVTLDHNRKTLLCRLVLIWFRRPNWWPRPPDVSDLSVVEDLLNALLVFRLLTRSPSEEAQGKLAAALAKTVPRSGSRGAMTSRTQKGIEDTASQSAIGATVVSTRQSLEVTRKGNHQQPGDYKAWLFTDDWYTPTGSTGNQDPTSSSKRSKIFDTESTPTCLSSNYSPLCGSCFYEHDLLSYLEKFPPAYRNIYPAQMLWGDDWRPQRLILP